MDVETRSHRAGEAARRAVDIVEVPSPAAIVARARRQRVRRDATVGIAVVAVLVLVVAFVAGGSSAGRRVTTTAATTSPGGHVADRYVPPTHLEHGQVVMPVTLPDGRVFELLYPPSLDIAGLGYRGEAGVSWNARATPKPCCDRGVSVTYESIRDAYGDAKPLKVYPGFDGRPVRYFRTPGIQKLNQLVFEFGPWLVQVFDYTDSSQSQFADAMTDHERAVFARSLAGHIDRSGYLVLSAHPPLRDLTSTDDVIGAGDERTLGIELFANRCSPREPASVEARTPFGGAAPGIGWCDRATGFRVSVFGPASAVAAAAANLQIRPAGHQPTKGR